jgi:hypothetical protein
MSDTPSSGEAVTKQRMVNSFLDNVRDNIESAIVWDSGNRPSNSTGQTLQNAIPAALTTGAIGLGSGTLGTPGTDKITDSKITAAQLATVLVNYVSIFTKIRKVNLQQYRDNDTIDSNETNVTHLSSNTYEQSNTLSSLAAADDVETDEEIDASNFNDFTTALYNQWNSLKDNAVTVQEFYCHSSCHTSCHGSRGRR